MRIPEIRDRLLEKARETGDVELEVLANHLTRRPPLKRAPVKSQPITPLLAARIRTYSRANPTASQRQIAEEYNVNPGRVSEVLRGKRS